VRARVRAVATVLCACVGAAVVAPSALADKPPAPPAKPPAPAAAAAAETPPPATPAAKKTPPPAAPAAKAPAPAAKKAPAPAAKAPAPAAAAPAPTATPVTPATASPASAAPAAAASPDPPPPPSRTVTATAQPAKATPPNAAAPDAAPVVAAVAKPAETPYAVGAAGETVVSVGEPDRSSPVQTATSPTPARSPAHEVAATPASSHATAIVAMHIPRQRSPLAHSPILTGPSRAVAVRSTQPAEGHVPSRSTQDGGSQLHLPFGPSGTASAASTAGSPGIAAALLWCAILVSLLVCCAQELRRHRVRVVPARSILAISPHPRPG
jgi:hypothetical protein